MGTRTNAGKILIVDDDTLLILGLMRRLRAAGYATVYAVDAHSAIDMARKESPDLIVLDLGMALTDGFWAIEQLRALPPTARIPIIVLTGRDDEGDQERAFKAGATDFLHKPTDGQQLLTSIQKALA